MLVALSSPVKFSKVFFFSVWNFVQSLKLYNKKFLSRQSLRITPNQTFSTVSLNWVADSVEIRRVYSTEIPSNIVTIKEVISTAIAYLTLYRVWHSGSHVQRRATNSQTNSHNFKT